MAQEAAKEFSVILAGKLGVGKTTIFRRIQTGSFVEPPSSGASALRPSDGGLENYIYKTELADKSYTVMTYRSLVVIAAHIQVLIKNLSQLQNQSTSSNTGSMNDIPCLARHSMLVCVMFALVRGGHTIGLFSGLPLNCAACHVRSFHQTLQFGKRRVVEIIVCLRWW